MVVCDAPHFLDAKGLPIVDGNGLPVTSSTVIMNQPSTIEVASINFADHSKGPCKRKKAAPRTMKKKKKKEMMGLKHMENQNMRRTGQK